MCCAAFVIFDADQIHISRLAEVFRVIPMNFRSLFKIGLSFVQADHLGALTLAQKTHSCFQKRQAWRWKRALGTLEKEIGARPKENIILVPNFKMILSLKSVTCPKYQQPNDEILIVIKIYIQKEINQ